MSKPEAARRLETSVYLLKRLTRDGVLSEITIGRRIYVTRASVERFRDKLHGRA